MDLLPGQRLLPLTTTALVGRANLVVEPLSILVREQLLQVPLKQCANLLCCPGWPVSFFDVARDGVEALT